MIYLLASYFEKQIKLHPVKVEDNQCETRNGKIKMKVDIKMEKQTT